jgi:hypothetical protein
MSIVVYKKIFLGCRYVQLPSCSSVTAVHKPEIFLSGSFHHSLSLHFQKFSAPPAQSRSLWTHIITPFTFSRIGWSVVRSAKVGTSKKIPLPHLHKVPTRSNTVSPQTFQTTLIFVIEQQLFTSSGAQWWMKICFPFFIVLSDLAFKI